MNGPLQEKKQALVQHPVAIPNRKLNPTTNNRGELKISKRTTTKRRCATFEAVMRVHGGSSTNNMLQV